MTIDSQTWDTAEAIRWLLNDEGLYRIARQVNADKGDATLLMARTETTILEANSNIDRYKVNWYQVWCAVTD